MTGALIRLQSVTYAGRNAACLICLVRGGICAAARLASHFASVIICVAMLLLTMFQILTKLLEYVNFATPIIVLEFIIK